MKEYDDDSTSISNYYSVDEFVAKAEPVGLLVAADLGGRCYDYSESDCFLSSCRWDFAVDR